MSGFGEFFDDKLAEREAEIKTEQDAKESAERERVRHEDAMTRPFVALYEPVRDAAASELAIKGIEYDDTKSSPVFMPRSIYSKSFKLKMQGVGEDKLTSSTYGFWINDDGFVEAYENKRVGSRFSKSAIYKKHVTDMTSEDVKRVIRSAIESLVSRI